MTRENGPAPMCPKCGHSKMLNLHGRCKHLIPVEPDQFYSEVACGCKCVFPAAPTDEVVAEPEMPETIFAWPDENGVHCGGWNQRRSTGVTKYVRADPPAHQPADDRLELAADECTGLQIGIGQEWMEMQRTWEGKTSREVWNQAVCACADAIRNLRGKQ